MLSEIYRRGNVTVKLYQTFTVNVRICPERVLLSQGNVPKVKVETQFLPVITIFFEAAGMKRLSVGMGLHKPTAPPHR